ncbi:hypothetical protein CRUP_008747 [Coryphaenoides rupestris]|nr:hypothetical protein CRUP_008747 [Coryphaenoides rupestris]
MLRRLWRSLRQVLFLMARRPGVVCGAVVLLGVLLMLAVERLKSVAEVSFIFFYAPWCAHSMAARHEVQTVAKKLAKQVQFVAINCWWSQGRCRKQHRLFQYPVIHLFYKRAVLKDFLSYHEPGVVGFFQFNSSPQPPGYLTYLLSALQALKRDFRGSTRFGVVTNRQVAEAISVREDQTVYLHRRFNSSLIFPRRERNFTSEGICSWVFQHQERALRWLQPPGTKSSLLERELSKGPALLLFLTHNPLSPAVHPFLKQMADIAVRYHSCDRRERRDWDGSPPDGASVGCQSVVQPGSGGADGSTTVCELCLNASRRGARASGATPCSFLSRALAGGASLLLHQSGGVAAARPDVSAGSSPATCSNFRRGYDPFSLYSACCRRTQLEPHGAAPPAANERPEEQGAGFVPSPSSPSSSSSSSSSSSIPPSSGPSQEGLNITGLRCRTNKTLNFYMLDVALTWPMAARLGAPGNASGSGPQGGGTEWSFATIIDLKDEVHYVLDRSPTQSLAESLAAPESGRPSSPREQEHQKRPLIVELTTASFLPSIMEAHKDVLVFYYTQWCGFCTALNHVLIQLARLFQGNSTMTIARKHLSVKFPDDELITLPNLLRFLLKHTGSGHHHHHRPPTVQSGRSPVVVAPGPGFLHAELHLLREELRALHQARQALALQVSRLWRDDHGPRRQQLAEQHREQSLQLAAAVRRLQALAEGDMLGHCEDEDEEGEEAEGVWSRARATGS